MKYLLLLEEAALFVFCIAALYYQPIQFSWWLWPLLFLLPDVGMLGYLLNTETGAATYNLLHHKGVAIFVLLLGFYIHHPYLILSGWILLGHSSMDRMFGYGLKYADSFKHTHLGWL